MLLLRDLLAGVAQHHALLALLDAHAIRLVVHAEDVPIPASYWGAPEAGLIGDAVQARPDTPVHSVLHEACHLICMGEDRRRLAYRDAGGNDLEECAVCYLQLCLAEQLPGVGWRRLATDMDTWGYSFRAGTTKDWFLSDAEDARRWLRRWCDVAYPLIEATAA